MNHDEIFVGIDVAKARLNIGLWPTGEGWSVPNKQGGVTELLTRLQGIQPELVVLEATGGLELTVTGTLCVAGLPVVVVNPR